MLVIFSTTDFPLGSRPVSVPGKFRVQFLLARPGHLRFTDREISFLTDVVGDSHIGIAKPAEQRVGDADVVGVTLRTISNGLQIDFKGIVNDEGYLGKIVAEDVPARDYAHAEALVYAALAPFLSAWSTILDVPVNIETTQVTDLTTHTDMLRIQAPFVEMKPQGGIGRLFSDEFCQYASLYREALNANSAFYRFLCLYKIVESLYARRSEKAKEAKKKGEAPRRYNEDIPLNVDAIRGILSILYPWREDWDELALSQILPPEAQGKRFKTIREKVLEPLRHGIAHGLMRSGKVERIVDRIADLNAANTWLPLLRIWVRLLLQTEFPAEFGVPQTK